MYRLFGNKLCGYKIFFTCVELYFCTQSTVVGDTTIWKIEKMVLSRKNLIGRKWNACTTIVWAWTKTEKNTPFFSEGHQLQYVSPCPQQSGESICRGNPKIQHFNTMTRSLRRSRRSTKKSSEYNVGDIVEVRQIRVDCFQWQESSSTKDSCSFAQIRQ